MTRLSVVQICRHSRVFRNDGARLRKAIEEAWTTDQELTVDFENVRIASVSFLDEGLGVLALEFPLDVLRKRLRVVNIQEQDRQLLNSILTSRARERDEAPKSSPSTQPHFEPT